MSAVDPAVTSTAITVLVVALITYVIDYLERRRWYSNNSNNAAKA